MESESFRIGIVGHGNLGKGVERALALAQGIELARIFTRREPSSLQPLTAGVPVSPLDEIDAFRNSLDVLILCGGSRSDLPEQTPALAERFNVVDSFDTHARIPEHFAAVDEAARRGGRTALISAGWDPGMFSLMRLFGEAILPQGTTHTFWGRGLSQGHSDAVRRVPGVKAGVQYTLPSEEAIEQVRAGTAGKLTTRQMHERECYVALEPGADPEVVRKTIVEMPNYFADYDTTVHFVDEETLRREHGGMPHGGFVLRSGTTAENHRHLVEYRLQLDSNPEFTASVLVAYARAVARLNAKGDVGAKTVFDVPPGLLSPKAAADLRRELL